MFVLEEERLRRSLAGELLPVVYESESGLTNLEQLKHVRFKANQGLAGPRGQLKRPEADIRHRSS